MHVVDERRSNIAQEISLLRKLGADRRFKSMQLFRDRQIRLRSLADGAAAVVMRTPEKAAA